MIDIDHFKSVNDTYGHIEGHRKAVYAADHPMSVALAYLVSMPLADANGPLIRR